MTTDSSASRMRIDSRHFPLFSILYQDRLVELIDEMSRRLNGVDLGETQKDLLRQKAAQVIASA